MAKGETVQKCTASGGNPRLIVRERERRAGNVGSVFFWRDRTREVDFLVEAGGLLELFEAKWADVP